MQEIKNYDQANTYISMICNLYNVSEKAKETMHNGLEQIQQELGFSSLTFQQILEQVSKEENDQLTPLFYQFQEKVALLQEVSENAKKMIELNLHTIEKALKQEKADSASSQKPIGSFHSRKI